MTFLLQSLYQKHQTQDSGAKIETANTPIWQNFWTFNCVFITFPANKDLPHGNLYNTKGLALTLNILFSLLCTTRNFCAYSSVFFLNQDIFYYSLKINVSCLWPTMYSEFDIHDLNGSTLQYYGLNREEKKNIIGQNHIIVFNLCFS